MENIIVGLQTMASGLYQIGANPDGLVVQISRDTLDRMKAAATREFATTLVTEADVKTARNEMQIGGIVFRAA